MRTPRQVELAITHRCNLRCLYCYHFGGAGDVGADLPTGEWLRFFEELDRCAVMSVVIGGGEPLLRKDLRKLIESVVAHRMRYSLLTNGTLVTPEIARFMASTKRCDHVQVSIDGATPEVHDSCRGKGNFARAIRGARLLMEHGVNTTVRVTIHRGNVNDLDNIARLLLEDMQLPGFSTNCAAYMGLCRQNADVVQLGVRDRVAAMETLVRLNRQYGGRISASAGPLAEARLWAGIQDARAEGKMSLQGCGYLTSCSGTAHKIGVRADGVIVPCTQLSHIELGRINRDSLADIWRDNREMNRLRNRHAIALGSFAFCAGCVYVPYCRGGCPAVAYAMTGRDDHPSPDVCLRKFLAEGGRLPAARIETVAGANGRLCSP